MEYLLGKNLAAVRKTNFLATFRKEDKENETKTAKTPKGVLSIVEPTFMHA